VAGKDIGARHHRLDSQGEISMSIDHIITEKSELLDMLFTAINRAKEWQCRMGRAQFDCYAALCNEFKLRDRVPPKQLRSIMQRLDTDPDPTCPKVMAGGGLGQSTWWSGLSWRNGGKLALIIMFCGC
jgi:hypothetical protein